MDYISPEVLIYIQTVKNYFEINNEAREFFLSNSDEELFYKHLIMCILAFNIYTIIN